MTSSLLPSLIHNDSFLLDIVIICDLSPIFPSSVYQSRYLVALLLSYNSHIVHNLTLLINNIFFIKLSPYEINNMDDFQYPNLTSLPNSTLLCFPLIEGDSNLVFCNLFYFTLQPFTKYMHNNLAGVWNQTNGLVVAALFPSFFLRQYKHHDI